MKVTEEATAANSVTVSHLSDYNSGSMASVLQGEQNVAMLMFDMYANGATNWTGGKLDKAGSNQNLTDAAFSIYKDSNGNGFFDAGTDAMVGGPYDFSQAVGQGYTLSVPQALAATPQRYFITYDISGTARLATTVGARIANSSYFTVSNGLSIGSIPATTSSLPTIFGIGAPLTRTYAADWDSGAVLAIPESGGATVTNSTCVTTTVTEPAGTNLVGLLNFPGHSCASVSGRYHESSEANPRFVTLYYNGPGYSSDMSQVKGISFKMRVRGAGKIFTVTMFYVRPDGVRVNAPTSSTHSPNNATNITMSLAGQTFTNVPFGSRLGVQIGVNGSGAYVGLGSAVDANLVVEETSGANSGFDVGTGRSIQNTNTYASSKDNIVETFTLNSPTGIQTVNSVTITGNATTTSANISLARLYADYGMLGALDPTDVQLPVGPSPATAPPSPV